MNLSTIHHIYSDIDHIQRFEHMLELKFFTPQTQNCDLRELNLGGYTGDEEGSN